MIDGIKIGKTVEREDWHASIPLDTLLENGLIGDIGGRLIITTNRITLSAGDALWRILKLIDRLLD